MVGDVVNVVMNSNLEKDQLKNDKNNYNTNNNCPNCINFNVN